jgi:hypothetical protein
VRWKVVLITGFPYWSKFSRWKEGWKQVSVVVNGCQEVQAPLDDYSTYPRHKKNQLCEIYVRWTSKLIFLSLFSAVNKNIYQQVNSC